MHSTCVVLTTLLYSGMVNDGACCLGRQTVQTMAHVVCRPWWRFLCRQKQNKSNIQDCESLTAWLIWHWFKQIIYTTRLHIEINCVCKTVPLRFNLSVTLFYFLYLGTECCAAFTSAHITDVSSHCASCWCLLPEFRATDERGSSAGLHQGFCFLIKTR